MTKHLTYLKPILCILLLLVLLGLIIGQVYNTIDSKQRGVLSKSEDYRSEIETPAKKMLNGYLGVFFRFKYLGNLNWLAVPLVFWFFWGTGRVPKERWQYALVTVWFLTFLFIAFKGYYNSRYQLTLLPFTLVVILLMLWEIVKHQKRYIKILSFGLLFLTALFNVVHYADQYKFFTDLKIKRSTAHFPEQLINFLNSRPDIGQKRSQVLVFNQPLYYYHTEKQGIDYQNPYNLRMFLQLLRKEGSSRKMNTLFRKKHKTKYILISWTAESQYKDRMMTEFLNTQCKLLFNDNGYKLYKIRDPHLIKELHKKEYRHIKNVQHLKPQIQGQRGSFQITKDPKQNLLTLINQKPDQEGRRLLQLSFGSTLGEAAGKYLHLIVEAKIPTHLINRENYIFIQDYKEGWERNRHYYAAKFMRRYLVSRKIRPGSTNISLGIRFVPKSPQDKLTIKSINAYISDNPL